MSNKAKLCPLQYKDIVLYIDGGKHGNVAKFGNWWKTNAFAPIKKTFYLSFDEDSVARRRKRVKGCAAMEGEMQFACVLTKKTLNLVRKPRYAYPHQTNRI